MRLQYEPASEPRFESGQSDAIGNRFSAEIVKASSFSPLHSLQVLEGSWAFSQGITRKPQIA